jgi:hypothetical protein
MAKPCIFKAFESFFFLRARTAAAHKGRRATGGASALLVVAGGGRLFQGQSVCEESSLGGERSLLGGISPAQKIARSKKHDATKKKSETK